MQMVPLPCGVYIHPDEHSRTLALKKSGEATARSLVRALFSKNEVLRGTTATGSKQVYVRLDQAKLEAILCELV